MNYKELVKQVAFETELTQANVKGVIDSLTGIIKEQLIARDDVKLPIGTFTTADRAARKIRDFKTGQMIDLEATEVVKFKMSGQLKKLLK